MPQKCETPHKGGASRNSCGGWLRDSSTPLTLQTQTLIACYAVRPEMAALVAMLAFGGGAHA